MPEPVVSHCSSSSAHHRLLVVLGLIGLAVLPVDTSCTAPPHCPAGQHAERAPSHQGHMWECKPDGSTA